MEIGMVLHHKEWWYRFGVTTAAILGFFDYILSQAKQRHMIGDASIVANKEKHGGEFTNQRPVQFDNGCANTHNLPTVQNTYGWCTQEPTQRNICTMKRMQVKHALRAKTAAVANKDTSQLNPKRWKALTRTNQCQIWLQSMIGPLLHMISAKPLTTSTRALELFLSGPVDLPESIKKKMCMTLALSFSFAS